MKTKKGNYKEVKITDGGKKKTYFKEALNGDKKGIIVIEYDGKLQSMMIGDYKSYLKQ